MKLQMILYDEYKGKRYKCTHELSDMEMYQYANGISAILIQTFHKLEKQIKELQGVIGGE